MNHGLTPVRLADAYRLPLTVVDYERPGDGILLCAGAGMMMARMDEWPDCRWGVDIGAARGNPLMGDWLEACARITTHLRADLWLSLTDPAWVRAVVARYTSPVVTYRIQGVEQ